MNIAKVDATVSTNLASRFGIRVSVRARMCLSTTGPLSRLFLCLAHFFRLLFSFVPLFSSPCL